MEDKAGQNHRDDAKGDLKEEWKEDPKVAFQDVKESPRDAKDLPDESPFKLLPRITISDNTSEVGK